MKKWIKWLAGFLAFMWVCTIISKSIYISKLPQVEIEKPAKKYITHEIETDGIVTAGAKQAINTLAGLRVLEIKVQEGDYVEKGTILFTIDMQDLSDMITTKEAELLKLQYQLADTQFNQILESQKKEVAKVWAQEDYVLAEQTTTIEVNRALEALHEAEKDLKAHIGTTVPQTSDAERQNAWNSYNGWKNRLYQAQDKKTQKERELSELRTRMESAEEMEEEEAEEIKRSIEEVENELMTLTDEITSLERDSMERPDFSSEESEYDIWQEKKSTLEDAVHSAKQGVEDAKRNKENVLLEKLRATATAEVLSPLDSSVYTQELEIAGTERELAELYTVKKQKGEVKADKSGYISEVQITVGNRTSDAAAILITDETQACQFRFSISKEQGKYLQLEDKVELKIKEEKLEASVDYMESNNSGGYDVICKLPDTIRKPGISGTVKKVEQGEIHYVTLPAEAVKEETKSYFVYLLKEKMGILGKEYYAEKIKVDIADQNEKLVALEEGAISQDSYVIISGTKEIKQGDSVRLE